MNLIFLLASLMINLQQLHYAYTLRQTRSFSLAAKEEGLTQSAISQQILKLETSIGFTIFDRKSKPLSLTEDGEKFMDHAQGLLLEAKHLMDFSNTLDSGERGELNIGVIPTLSPYLVPLFINELHDRFPDIRLIITELKTDEIIAGLRNRSIDAGILSTPIDTSLRLKVRKMFYEKFFLYVSSEHPLYQKTSIPLSDISGDDLWLLSEGNCFSDQVNNMCELDNCRSFKSNLDYRSNSIHALRRIVEHKGGLTFLPELATLSVDESSEDLIKEITGTPRAREISLVTAKGEPKIDLINNVIDVVLDCLPKHILDASEKEIVSA